MNELENPIIVDFPLRGEWTTPSTPGSTIPSHGTDDLGQRYAYDIWSGSGNLDNFDSILELAKTPFRFYLHWFLSGLPFKTYSGNRFRFYLFGIPLKSYFSWGKEVFAPCDGKVVKVFDGFKENRRISLFSKMPSQKHEKFNFRKMKSMMDYKALSKDIEKNGYQILSGNFIVIQCGPSVYAFLCHLQNGSINVSVGQEVKKGDLLAKVGHSGNSTEPHLHFHLMDREDLLSAKGVPCAFREYEVWRNGEWIMVSNGIPTYKERIRVQ